MGENQLVKNEKSKGKKEKTAIPCYNKCHLTRKGFFLAQAHRKNVEKRVYDCSTFYRILNI